MTFHDYLLSRHACHDAIEWVADRPAREAWHECADGSWMIWLCTMLGVRRELVVLCATGCARSVLHLVPVGEDRSRLAVETAEEWGYGHATREEAYVAAAYAADAAAADDDAAYAAAYAARAAHASDAACAASAARAAAYAASDAAYAAARAADAAGICTREHALARYARGVREVIPWWHVADRLVAAGVEVV